MYIALPLNEVIRKYVPAPCFTCISWEEVFSPALISIRTFVAKSVIMRFLRNFCGRYLVDKMLCGRYLGFFTHFCREISFVAITRFLGGTFGQNMVGGGTETF